MQYMSCTMYTCIPYWHVHCTVVHCHFGANTTDYIDKVVGFQGEFMTVEDEWINPCTVYTSAFGCMIPNAWNNDFPLYCIFTIIVVLMTRA